MKSQKITEQEYQDRIKNDWMTCSHCKFNGGIRFFSMGDHVKKYPYCFECRKSSRDQYENNRRNKDLNEKFGISLDQYNYLLRLQNNKCKICKKPESYKNHKTNKLFMLAVDHCHKSGIVRGLLCRKCNTGLGHFEDNWKYFNAASRYVRASKFSLPLILD